MADDNKIRMNTVQDINSFDEWVLEVIKNSKHLFVKSAQEMIDYFFDLENKNDFSIHRWEKSLKFSK